MLQSSAQHTACKHILLRFYKHLTWNVAQMEKGAWNNTTLWYPVWSQLQVQKMTVTIGCLLWVMGTNIYYLMPIKLIRRDSGKCGGMCRKQCLSKAGPPPPPPPPLWDLVPAPWSHAYSLPAVEHLKQTSQVSKGLIKLSVLPQY